MVLMNLFAGSNGDADTESQFVDTVGEEKEYVKAVYCHPAYLTYMQSTS